MAYQHGDFYQKFRKSIREWARTDEGESHKYVDYLLSGPDIFHLLCKLTVDPDVSTKDKAKLAAAIAYFVSPIDLVPEAIVGPIGYVDDIALSAYVLNTIVNNTHPDVIRRHWAGDGDALQLIQEILKIADDMVGSGLWRKLKGMVS